jgi:hypothetical protein
VKPRSTAFMACIIGPPIIASPRPPVRRARRLAATNPVFIYFGAAAKACHLTAGS